MGHPAWIEVILMENQLYHRQARTLVGGCRRCQADMDGMHAFTRAFTTSWGFHFNSNLLLFLTPFGNFLFYTFETDSQVNRDMRDEEGGEGAQQEETIKSGRLRKLRPVH